MNFVSLFCLTYRAVLTFAKLSSPTSQNLPLSYTKTDKISPVWHLSGAFLFNDPKATQIIVILIQAFNLKTR